VPPLRVSIRSGRSLVVHGHAKVRLACSGGVVGSTCKGRLSLTFRQRIVRRVHRHGRVIQRTIVLASARYTVPSGRTRTVRLRLSHAGMRLLERRRDRRLRVRATATVSGGTAVHGAIVVRLAPPPRSS